MLKVAKFGGSSVANAAQFTKVKNIIKSDSSRKIVVISASGKRFPEDNKLTDLLYLTHAHLTYGVSEEEIVSCINDRFKEITAALSLSGEVLTQFQTYAKGLSKDTSVDELVSRGEYFTSMLMAEYLGYDFVDAADCILFGYDGKLDEEKTYEAIRTQLIKHKNIVLPGFYGKLPNGKIKVMTRGGSDITGALAAAAVKADVYENWTDVSGILMADPKIVENPKPIENITYAELQELATMGASVLHEDALKPVRRAGIPLNIRNTNAPSDAGTMIVGSVNDSISGDRFITGIAGKKNFTILTVKKQNSHGTGALRKSLEILDAAKVDIESVSLGQDSFNIVVPSGKLEDRLYDILHSIKEESEADDVRVQDGISLISAVGRKMSFRPGIAGMVFKSLGENRVNIRTIKQGADEISIMIGVDNRDFEKAVRVLYEEFAG